MRKILPLLVWLIAAGRVTAADVTIPGTPHKLVTSNAFLLISQSGASGHLSVGEVDKWLSTNKSIFNVKDYGAVGNDWTKDNPAIQEAIDRAGTNGGGIVFHPALAFGNYGLGSNFIHGGYQTEGKKSSLVIRSNGVYLVFASTSCGYTQQCSIGSAQNMIGAGNLTGPKNIGLINARLIGDTTPIDLIQFDRCTNVLFRDCIAERTGADAFDTQNCERVRNENPYTRAVANAISTQDDIYELSGFLFENGNGGNPAIESLSTGFTAHDGKIRGYTNNFVLSGGEKFTRVTFDSSAPGPTRTNGFVQQGGATFTDCYFTGGFGMMASTNASVVIRGGSITGAGILANRCTSLLIEGVPDINTTGVGVTLIAANGVRLINNISSAANFVRCDSDPAHSVEIRDNRINGDIYCEPAGTPGPATTATNWILSGNNFTSGNITLGNSASNQVVNNWLPAGTMTLNGGGNRVSANRIKTLTLGAPAVGQYLGNNIGTRDGSDSAWLSSVREGNRDNTGALLKDDWEESQVVSVCYSNANMKFVGSQTLYTVPAGYTFQVEKAWSVLSELADPNIFATGQITISGVVVVVGTLMDGAARIISPLTFDTPPKVMLGGDTISLEIAEPSDATTDTRHLYFTGLLRKQ